ncbi:hypothetical protein ACFOSD_14550 [Salinispirillum marinum]|uniref:Uncharacterized protein n=2 Tax=Saccharospirillaceae TaxID=255527 RepID=A0ABV8BIB4_9GAMM
METLEQRIKRLELATERILTHPVTDSFSALIEPNRRVFKDFRIVYATDNLRSEFGGVSLDSIENECPAVSKYFGAPGLLFYDDELYETTKRDGFAKFPLDYSVSFDTQVAEAFRVYEEGKKVADWEWFVKLVQLVKVGDGQFNFDYTFYIVEDLVHTYDESNLRPFNTIRALKRLDHLDEQAFADDPRNPKFNGDRASAGRQAAEAIYSFQESKEIQQSLVRRKGLKLVLMRAMLLRWEAKRNHHENLLKLVAYSVDCLGRFGKMELYFAWKLLKHGDKHRFFGSLLQPSDVAMEKINGMSWDLFSLRHQETMASNSQHGMFYIPFIATFDRRFKELFAACPIRCMLVDDRYKRTNVIFFDELEFFADLNLALDEATKSRLSNTDAKIARLSSSLRGTDLDEHLGELENECKKFLSVVRANTYETSRGNRQ